VEDDVEFAGLDARVHAEQGYDLAGMGGSSDPA
jgi:hypothetical protein